MYRCFHCYGPNAVRAGVCQHCDRRIEPPDSLSYDEQLIWTLDDPDGGHATLAAQILGMRRARLAVAALRRIVTEMRDPFLVAAALRSLIKIEGREPLRDLLMQLAASDSFLLADLATRALYPSGAQGGNERAVIQ
jgi:hypothetical protein